MISDFIAEHKLSESFNDIAEQYYMPLAEEIKLHQNEAKKTYFVGINGSQGSGKSTLSEFIKAYLSDKYSLKIVIMSLDDFYFSQEQRQVLSKRVHTLLNTRGVPGTHDMDTAKQALDALQSQQPCTIPRFNKATDNPHKKSLWTNVSSVVDIVIFEGWCWGVPPQSKEALATAVNTLEEKQDQDHVWREYVNTQLSLFYAPLYSYMDKWVMLSAPSFNDVYAWRLEQEQKLIEVSKGNENKGLMNDKQVLDFIQFYQRLTEHGLATLPNLCDHVFKLNSKRKIVEHKCKVVHAK